MGSSSFMVATSDLRFADLEEVGHRVANRSYGARDREQCAAGPFAIL